MKCASPKPYFAGTWAGKCATIIEGMESHERLLDERMEEDSTENWMEKYAPWKDPSKVGSLVILAGRLEEDEVCTHVCTSTYRR